MLPLLVLLATLVTQLVPVTGASHRHQARFLAREPTVKVIDSDAVPVASEQRNESVAAITDVSILRVDEQSPQEQDEVKIEVVRMQTKMVMPGGSMPTLTSQHGKEAEKTAMKIFTDMFEAWGGKVPDVGSVKALGKEDRGRLVPFGRQEPKMCVSVEVLVPEFTAKDSVTKIIEGRIYKVVEVIGTSTEKASATVAATASAKQHAAVQADASGTASFNTTATAEANYTAFAEATDQVTASYQATATAAAGSPVKENDDIITKAKIKIEAHAISVQKATASATRRASATRSAKAIASEGVTVKLSQTGSGQSDAEANRTASATAEDSKTVTKKMNVGSEGLGKLKKLFEASATAQSLVESKACISARKARSLLGPEALQQTGVPFAMAVYNQAHSEAFAKAKEKAAGLALDAAKQAAKKHVQEDLMNEIQSYAKEHSVELKNLALDDAVKSTLGQKHQLEAAASAEAFQMATAEVHRQAPEKALRAAQLEAMKAAKDEATRRATEEAKANAAKGLEEKVMAKAMAEAKAKAKLSAELKAKATAKALAEEAAKASALVLAHQAAQQRAEEEAEAKAKALAEAQAVGKAKNMVRAGSETETVMKHLAR